ncbi:MAG: hypothetical protein ACYDAN_01770 [Candidatus Limnocylindrales bacterium]
MISLPEHLRRLDPVRPRSIEESVSPYLARAGTHPSRYVEEAALTVLAAVYQRSGPLREQLLAERPRFERLASLVYRAPERREGGR